MFSFDLQALERNMSLSTQYLEELSRRYKKQVEEMQRLLDKTLATFNAESRKKDEKNQLLEEQIQELQRTVEILVSERNSWKSFLYCIFLICSTVVAFVIFCRRSTQHKQPEADKKMGDVQRRYSVSVVSHAVVPKKRRRPSEEALKIKGTYEDLIINETDLSTSKSSKRKRKKRSLARSNSISTLSEETENKLHTVSSDTVFSFKPTCTSSRVLNCQEPTQKTDLDWVEHSVLQNGIQTVPFLLDESEHTSLEPLIFTDNNTKKSSDDTSPRLSNDLPSFMKTAADVRLNRSSSHNPPTKPNGNKVHRKTASLDEHVNNLNGNLDLHSKVEDIQGMTPKKEKKGLKRILKKVF